jgi:glutaconate CoA-transferase subunit A
VACPYTGESLATVPALNPDVAVVHAQRADASGNTQVWGLVGTQKEAAFASKRVIVVVEELVDESVIRQDPNRTIIPGMAVDAVVVEPWGAHPSYAQGYYDRDNDFYVDWEAVSRDPARFAAYLDEWVFGVNDRAAYVARQPALAERLTAESRVCAGVNYGY